MANWAAASWRKTVCLDGREQESCFFWHRPHRGRCSSPMEAGYARGLSSCNSGKPPTFDVFLCWRWISAATGHTALRIAIHNNIPLHWRHGILTAGIARQNRNDASHEEYLSRGRPWPASTETPSSWSEESRRRWRIRGLKRGNHRRKCPNWAPPPPAAGRS